MRQQPFYYSDGPYLQALQGLHGALCQAEAFVKFVGQPRTGKSSVCEKLTQFLQHKQYQVVYFDYAIESPEMLRAMLAQELDLPGSSSLASQLESLLVSSSDKPIIIVFDDAHLLTDITLLEIYQLADIQLNGNRVINILLCGEPSLEKRLLDKEEFKSLQHRVSHNFLLEPMDADTTAQFLTAYLAKLGLGELQLDVAAMAHFYKSCKGFPGLASSVAHLLVEARATGSNSGAVSKDELLGLIKKADASEPLPTLQYRERNQWLALGPLTAVLVIASLAVLYQQLNSSETIDTGTLASEEVATFVEVEPEVVADANPVQLQARDDVAVFVEQEPEPSPTEQPELPDIESAPVSDSNLSLVTAEEIGLTEADIVEPVFEQFPIDVSAAAVNSALVENLPATINKLAETENEAVAADTSSSMPASTTEPSVASNNAATETAETSQPVLPTESELEVAALEDEAEPQAPPERGVEISSALELIANTAPALLRQVPSSDEAIPPASASAEQSVHDWVDAWESQDFDAYFSSYHPEFVPRYHDSRSEWRQNRERVIGNANRISLQLSDFTIISEDENSMEVHFWLAYQSPTYRDNTRKKLVLSKPPATGRESSATETGPLWLILEEVNLEVRT